MNERVIPQSTCNILSISDIEVPIIYSTQIQKRFAEIDLAISCGDLGYYYLEYIISMLDIPLYYVQGNHAPKQEFSTTEARTNPWGAINIHRKVIYNQQFDLILAGIEGSLRYNKGAHQYTQGEMWAMVLNLVPRLLLNKLQYGRYLDIFITHAPPKDIHDQDDLCHQGIKAFNWFNKVFSPTYHLHGHIHLYDPRQERQTIKGKTTILNTYGYQEIKFSKSKT